MRVNKTDSAAGIGVAGESAARVAIDLRRLPWVRRLALDYANDFSRVAPFFSGNPADAAAWAQAIARSQSHPRRHREIAQILHAQQQRRGAPARAVDAAQQLNDSRSVAVVTGQQAGLFGGPLFTLLKAITALKLAERVSREHRVTVIPVFWVDAEDHDWDEVRRCTVFDAALTPRTVGFPPRVGDDPAPVGTVRLDDSVAAVVDELEQILAPSEFRSSLLADIRDVYRPGAGMAEAFGSWLERVLGSRGLVVFDASDLAAKPLASGVFGRELSAPGRTAALAAEAGAELVARGYHAQVHSQDEGPALFRLDGGRRPIRRQGGDWLVGDATYSPSVLATEAAERPAGFSPNVLLRPIVQDAILPTVCYVAGPSELAYLGQLRRVYEHFGVPMPLVYPRATATLVDSAALRFLAKYDVPLEALQPQDEAGLNELLEAQIPPTIERSYSEAAGVIEAHMVRLAQVLPELDATLEGAARSTLGKIQHDLETLHGKMIQAAKRRDDTLRRQYLRTRALAFPDGHIQERTIAFVSFLNQYGPALVDRLFDELALELGSHWIISV